MQIDGLKRIKVSSDQQLRNWLAKHPDQVDPVLLVTCNKTSRDKYVSVAQVQEALVAHGWQSGFRYTLKGNLVGHVVHRP